MSTRWAPLNLVNLTNALANVPDWKIMGIQLKVRHGKLRELEQQYLTIPERRAEMLQTWLESNPDASWKDIVTALRNMGLNTEASIVEKTFCPSSPGASPSPTQPEPQVDKLKEVQDEINNLERKFRNLVFKAQDVLIEKQSESSHFLSKLQSGIALLPASCRQQHVLFLKEHKAEIVKAGSVMEIFYTLNTYWNFWCHSLFDHVIESFSNDELKASLESYEEELNAFLKKTNVIDFIRACSSYLKLPPKFSMVVMKCDWENYSVYQIKEFHQDLTRASSLEEFAMLLIRGSIGSVVLIWAVPSTTVDFVVHAMDDGFLEKNRIIAVHIDGKEIHAYQRQYTQTQLQLETGAKPVVSVRGGGGGHAVLIYFVSG